MALTNTRAKITIIPGSSINLNIVSPIMGYLPMGVTEYKRGQIGMLHLNHQNFVLLKFPMVIALITLKYPLGMGMDTLTQ